MKSRFGKFRQVAVSAVLAAGFLASSAQAANVPCATCMPNEPFFRSFTTLRETVNTAIQFQEPAPRRLANVAGMLNQPFTPLVPERNGPAVDPADFPLPGAFDPRSVDPTFRSEYWNWQVPALNTWLPQVWGL